MYYYQTTNVGLGLFSNSASSGGGDAQFEIQLDPTNRYPQLVGWATIFLTSSVAGALNSWNHLVVCRSGTTASIFLNGTRVATATVSNNFSSVNAFNIGRSASGGNTLTGYMSNVRAVKGSSVYDPTLTTLTVPTIPLTAIANTSLLTCQSNRFIDTSTNNFTITVAGNTTVRSFNPFVPNASYSTYGSTYLNGSAAYINIPNNAAFAFGTGDFTIEFWVNTTDPAGGLVSQGVTGGWATTFYSNTVYWQSSWNQVNLWTSPASSITNGVWHHLAFSRASGSTKFFIDGVLAATNADTTNYSVTSGSLIIGRDGNPTDLEGYISDLRVVKGTAVYTTNFTPPSAPLTAISGTSLLTLQNNQPVNNSTFLDNSTNNFLVTRNGNTTQGTFSPYGGNWSNYFDGTGDYLSLASNAAFNQNTAFTVECWVNSSAGGYFFTQLNSGYLGLNYTADTRKIQVDKSFVGIQITSTNSFAFNQWHHVAMSYDGTTTRLFVNGALEGSVAGGGSASSAELRIGNYNTGSNFYTGYISNLRISNSALYTSAFTPSTTPLTPTANTRLLTCADNRLIDDSINNFTITKGGDVSVQRFSPFNPSSVTPTSYSGYFDGTGDYLTVTNNVAFTFTSDFTIECWVYGVSNQPSNDAYPTIFSTSAFNSTGIGLKIQSSGGVGTTGVACVWNNGSQILTGTTVISNNNWYHLSVSRSGTSMKLFVNGVAENTITNNTTFTVSAGYPLVGGDTTNAGFLTGYVSNLRVVKGTAVYTSNFTPPTSQLTAIANTSLLTCQSPTFIDNSTNNFTITAFGNSKPTIQNPFGFTSALTNGYTVSTIGGSAYFDGTGDYLSTPSLISASGDFTLECWFNTTIAVSGVRMLCGGNIDASASDYLLINASGVEAQFGSGSATVMTAAYTFVPNTWYHVAMTRSGTTVKVFVNGVSLTTSQGTQSETFSIRYIAIGYIGLTYTGYISDLRFVVGTSIYTSNFVPPSAPLTAVQNTSLLTNMTSAGIYDAAMMNNMESVGDAKLSTAISKFGGSSMYFDGTGDYLSMPSTQFQNFAFGTGDFTIECWLYQVSFSGDTVWMASYLTWASSVNFYCATRAGTPNVLLFRAGDSVPITLVGNTGITANTWTHVAITRASGVTRMFVGGVLQTNTHTGSVNISATVQPVGIGAANNGSEPINGYIDDLRITKGYARYTANFTAPTATFQIK